MRGDIGIGTLLVQILESFLTRGKFVRGRETAHGGIHAAGMCQLKRLQENQEVRSRITTYLPVEIFLPCDARRRIPPFAVGEDARKGKEGCREALTCTT